MSNIRMNLIHAATTRARLSIGVGFEQKILDDDSLTEEEKTEAIRLINKGRDANKIIYNYGTRRICENCNQKCLATLYCEYCIQNYLKANFSNWTSGNNIIDHLIKTCQVETCMPNKVIEWIPYNNLENIKHVIKGRFSEIYTADWIDGRYEEWDSKVQQLVRFGTRDVILKELKNQSWFEEAKTHLIISNKYPGIIQCFGLTKNPLNGNYLLVMMKFDMNLKEYLQQNHDQLTWKERIGIIFQIIESFYCIHDVVNSIHRDLHSGNILYSQFYDSWRICDLGFCGPADKPLTNTIYGNLPYIAPEVIIGSGYTFKSDIYSIAMLMWEISSGQPPFKKYEHDCSLPTNIIDGMRPKIVSEIPSKYKSLMEQCWDADPLKRPDIYALKKNIKEIKIYYQNNPNELPQLILAKVDKEKINMNSKSFTSKILHKFENLPEPKNATEVIEEQKAFYTSRLYDFSISSNDNDSKESPRLSKKLKIENVDIQDDYEREFIQQRSNSGTNDEVQNNPSLHSEQDTKSEFLDDEL